MKRQTLTTIIAGCSLMLGLPALAQAPMQGQPGGQDFDNNGGFGQQAQEEFTVSDRMGGMFREVDLQDVSVEQALQWWSENSGIPIQADWDGLRFDAELGSTVNLQAQQMPVRQMLQMLVDQGSGDFAELVYEQANWGVRLMTKEEANNRRRVEIYDVTELLMVIPQFTNAPSFDLNDVMDQGQQMGGGRGSGRGGRGGSRGGRGGSRGGRGGGRGGRGGGRGGGGFFDQEELDLPDREERAEELVNIIQETVEPEAWEEGHASIRYYDNHLVVNAPDYVHRQIGRPIQVGGSPSGAVQTNPYQDDVQVSPRRQQRPSQPASTGVSGSNIE